jgi:hypothetical protein
LAFGTEAPCILLEIAKHSNYVAEQYLVSVEVVVWAVSAEREGVSAEATSHGGGAVYF